MPTTGIGEDEPCWCRGECCSSVRIPDEYLEYLLEHLPQPVFDRWFVRTNDGVFTKDTASPDPESDPDFPTEFFHCIFWDARTRLCRFYRLRPEICQVFDHTPEDGYDEHGPWGHDHPHAQDGGG